MNLKCASDMHSDGLNESEFHNLIIEGIAENMNLLVVPEVILNYFTPS